MSLLSAGVLIVQYCLSDKNNVQEYYNLYMENAILRQAFRLLNKFFMVPAYRLGLGAFISNPLSGYIMVIKTTGRKSGRARYTPVNYALMDGCIYCLSGWRSRADWYRNVMANPRLEVLLPGGALMGIAEEVVDPDEQLRAARQLLKNAGFVGFTLGFNPFTASDEEVRHKCQGIPALRIRPHGVGSGPADPGGWLWVLMTILSVLWLSKRLSKRRRTTDSR
jgi:deazaflavin-dependent oxidoreductase (nitroreductase family)